MVPDPKFRLILSNLKSVCLFLFVAFGAFLALFGHISPAEAGFFASNSQLIGLQPNSGLDPKAALGGGGIAISGDALLPDAGVAGTLADVKITPSSDEISIYIVREGDSLSQVAEMFGVSVNTIIWANDLPRATAIREGQQLVILPITGVRHTVAKGETIQSIAKKYKGDAGEIIQFNGLDPDGVLAQDEVVIIPNGEEVAPAPKAGKRVVRGSGGPSYAGYYLRPIVGGVKTQGLHGYNGIDLGAPAGTEIMASAAGRVIVSKKGGWNGGYGNYVVIEHANGTQTLYAHNSDNIVSVGQTVVQGQVIGYVGSTGRSTGPHLHLEVRGAENPF